MEKNIVVKSNPLIEASYRLTVAEQGIILSCISQIHKNDIVTDLTMYVVSVSDYVSLTGTKLNTAYRDMRGSVARLWRREVKIPCKPNGEGQHKEILVTRWIQSIKYCKKNSSVELRFSRDILPYITNLSKNFTMYALGNVSNMSSNFGIRFYEILIQWRNKNEVKREVSVDCLRCFFCVEGKYSSIKDFKKRVLEPAVLDVNNHSDLWVNWVQRKTGRKVTHIIFTFGLKKNNCVTKKRSYTKRILGISKSRIEKEAEPGESYEQAALRISKKMEAS